VVGSGWVDYFKHEIVLLSAANQLSIRCEYPLPISCLSVANIRCQSVVYPLRISAANQLSIRCQYPLPNSYLSVANIRCQTVIYPLPISAAKQLSIRCLSVANIRYQTVVYPLPISAAKQLSISCQSVANPLPISDRSVANYLCGDKETGFLFWICRGGF
jgi:hypothetical protein